MGMNHIEVLMEPKYMSKSLTQALTTLSAFALQSLRRRGLKKLRKDARTSRHSSLSVFTLGHLTDV